MKFIRHLSVAKTLFMTDMKLFRQVVVDRYINLCVWCGCVVFVNAYLLPKFGISESCGLLSLAGLFSAIGVFQVFGGVVELAGDLESDKTTHYYATLAIPVWMMFVRLIVSSATIYSFFTIAMVPFGKIMLWNRFDLLAVDWVKFAIVCVVGSLFYGAFLLFTTSFVPGRQHVGNVWMRFIFPLWFLGGFSFSWATLHQTLPAFAYIDLLNPMMFMTEAYRSAVIGPEGFLPFWFSVSAIALFGVAAGWVGIRRLKKRLDFI